VADAYANHHLIVGNALITKRIKTVSVVIWIKFCGLLVCGGAMSNVKIIHGDCMTAMASMKDKAFDLAICDIPYGIESAISKGGGSHTKSSVKFHQLYSENGKTWDKAVVPEYFIELQRVSVNQIIFGANYYNMPACRGFIVYDKPEMRIHTMSDCEYAWTSFDRPAKIHSISRGFNNNITNPRIHPTQKPIRLYQAILKNYAKPGDKILDTHGGSCSLAIACDIMGFDAVIYEIDLDYYKAATERFNRHKQQTVLEFTECHQQQ
jgi:site-specific DNA-methyltransferase (adenine-specific)